MLEAGAGVADRAVAEGGNGRDVGELRQDPQRVSGECLGASELLFGDTLDAGEVDRLGRIPRAGPGIGVGQERGMLGAVVSE